MSEREIFITEFDRTRLQELIGVVETFGDRKRAELSHLIDLQEELDRATIVSPEKVPADTVTMNSRVLLRDIDTLAEMTYTLVFPRDADISKGNLSIFAPVGTAILGYREGDVIEWEVPAGKRRLIIVKVLYQPEAAGDFHL